MNPQEKELLDAAAALLGARQDEMLTVEEVVRLARAVAAIRCQSAPHLREKAGILSLCGTKAVDWLTPRDCEQIRQYKVQWDENTDGLLPEEDGE